MQGTTVKLANNNREREMYDNIADLYSIIKTVEALEKAYVRDAITTDDYRKQCQKLITQFKAAQNLTKDVYPDILKFANEYRIDNCKAALHRLLNEPYFSTPNPAPKVIVEIAQLYITAMDSLKLNMCAVDQLHPLMNDLYERLGMIGLLPSDWEGKVKIKQWIVQLNRMKASDELDAEQVRQMLFDLDSSYATFHKSLEMAKH
eukprot:TRINITY_DN1306_c0_g1_i2.p1 TRINITY_DN1306_c0_g1~~TRINITY_DN1306_c0_g1_i2.p1  ORF type:complete len:204 (-),score=38.33 TRINITY_DN1306_c0_g1_i2:261-872(-)